MRLIRKGPEPPLFLAYRKTQGVLGRRQGGAFSDAVLRRALAECSTPDVGGNLPPFAGALEWWLRRRLGERSV